MTASDVNTTLAPFVQLDTTGLPAGLTALPRWVSWRYIERGGRRTKCPVNPKTGSEADSTDPTTWSTFEDACSSFENGNGLAGIGFVFTAEDGFCGVDLDNCRDAETGEIAPWARQIIDSLDSYTEVSPSGAGVKVFAAGRKPGRRCRRRHQDGEVEMYDRKRFFTLTGLHVEGTPRSVESRQVQLTELYEKVFGDRVEATGNLAGVWEPQDSESGLPSLSDDEVIEKATLNAKFAALWAGRWNEHFASQSEADSSLVFMMAFYTKDAAQIDRLFRQSGLYRPKWDGRRGEATYGEITIRKALELVTEQYDPSHPGAGASPLSESKDEAGDDEEESPVPLGTRDPHSGRLVLSPRRTLPTAEAFVREFHSHPDGRTLMSYAGLLMAWRDNRYAEVEDETFKQVLQAWLHKSLRYIVDRRTGDMLLIDFESNPTTVKAALDSIRTYVHIRADITPPAWLDGDCARPPAGELLVCRSKILHLPTMDLVRPSPRLFVTSALDFDYDPDAPRPTLWHRFLDQVFADDPEAVYLLQTWFGYLLTGDTSLQKMMLLVGPKRSGKGTIGRVLAKLVGSGNTCGPTTSSLAGPFGLQPLVGKSLAVVSDARFTGDNIATVVERLLCISGEDALTVDRKYLPSVTMKLPTRFMFLTNELPKLTETSGALAGRFLVLKFSQSFYRREDPFLTDKLLAELPGILK